MGIPTLYYALFSPPARACILTAKLIGLDLKLRAVDFSQKEHLSDWFLKINPQHQVPVLVDDDGEIYIESHAIIAFLVAKYAKGSDKSLYPTEIKLKAHVDHMLHFENGVLFQVIKDMVARNIYGGEADFNVKTVEMCHNAYSFLESYLQNGKYVVGNHMTVADISIITTLTTLDLLIPLEKEKYPMTCTWAERMKSLPGHSEINVSGSQLLCNRIKGMMEQNCGHTVRA